MIGYTITAKGRALLAAIDAGLVKEKPDGGYDIKAFERFWAVVERDVVPLLVIQETKQMRDHAADDRADNGTEKRHDPCAKAIARFAPFALGAALAVALLLKIIF